jgi:hypothetical protein
MFVAFTSDNQTRVRRSLPFDESETRLVIRANAGIHLFLKPLRKGGAFAGTAVLSAPSPIAHRLSSHASINPARSAMSVSSDWFVAFNFTLML